MADIRETSIWCGLAAAATIGVTVVGATAAAPVSVPIAAGAFAGGLLSNIAASKIDGWWGRFKTERLKLISAGKTLDSNHDEARALRLAQLEALRNILIEYSKDLTSAGPEHAGESGIVEKALRWVETEIGATPRLTISLNPDVETELRQAVDTALIGLIGQQREAARPNPAIDPRAVAEAVVFKELADAVGPLPGGLQTKLKTKGNGWFDRFATQIAEKIKHDPKMRDIWMAMRMALLGQSVAEVQTDLKILLEASDRILAAVNEQGAENRSLHQRTEDEANRRHRETMDAIIHNTGLPIRIIEDLFKSVEMEFPESNIEAKVYEALARIKTLTEQKIDTGNLGEDVRLIFEAANRTLEETKDVDAASAVLDPLIDNAEHAMLAAAQASAQQAQMYETVYRFDEAIAAYEKAARYNPENHFYWGQIGNIRVHRGNLAGALEAVNRTLEVATAHASQREVSVSLDVIGNIRMAQGDISGALQAYQDARKIRETLVREDPHNLGWQHDLGVSLDRLGDFHIAQKNLTHAWEAYQASHNIAKALTKIDPKNSKWQHDLFVSLIKIGDMHAAQGNFRDALQAYQAGSDIIEEPAKVGPRNAAWQRGASVIYSKLGDTLAAQSNLKDALQAYQTSFNSAEALAKADPKNTEWQLGLSICYERIGDIHTALGDLCSALSAYQAAFNISETLALADPSNMSWLRDLIISHVKIAEAGGDAASHYRQALAIAERLEAEGKLVPADASFPSALRKRLKVAEGE